jgi:hypothetical protein
MSDSKKPAAEYEVGYRRPPKAHQFKKGQINNPNGRPRGRVNLLDAALKEAARLVQVRKGDEVESITRSDAIMRVISDKALRGDVAAIRLWANLLIQAAAQRSAEPRERSTSEGASPVVETVLPGVDEEVVARMLRRFSHLVPEGEEP